MKENRVLYFLLILFILPLSCTGVVKKNVVVLEGRVIEEPTEEQEKKIKLSINFDGTWKKNTGSKAFIIIQGKTGKIVGNNGGEIPIKVNYLDEKTVKITEYEYNVKYLLNWFPEEIAKQIYNDSRLTNTYSVLRIVDNDTLVGVSYTWEVFYVGNKVENIQPIETSERWKRIKD